MRRLRFPLVASAALLLGLVGAGPAAAQPDHLHLDLTLVACGTVQATGFHLPESARLNGSRLALEIMARDLPPGGYLDVDEVVLHLLPNQ